MISKDMKNNKQTEKIHILDKPAKLSYIEGLKKNLLSNKLEDSEIVNLGLNRNQFFIRLPTRMTNRINLKKEDKIKVEWSGTDDEIEIKLEVVKDG